MKIAKTVMCALLAVGFLILSPNGLVWADDFSIFYIFNVPYVHQADTYWCGPASLTMSLNYWGANVTQEEVAAEIYNPATNITEISKMKAYPQKLEFRTEELVGSINHLKVWISRGCPLIVLQRFSLQNTYGHYRVVVGYNDEEELVATFDPILGSNYNITYTEFADLWKPGSTFSTINWTLAIIPRDSFLTNLMEKYQRSMNQQTLSTDGQPMKTEDIYLIVSAIALALGAVGGIPEIMRWTKPKPRLRITKARIETMKDHRIKIHLEVKNEQKWWRRNSDASDVAAEWYMMDKNHEQWGGVFNQTVSPYLMAGTKVSREFSSVHAFKPEGNPHTVVILVRCAEGVLRREKITYVATSHQK